MVFNIIPNDLLEIQFKSEHNVLHTYMGLKLVRNISCLILVLVLISGITCFSSAVIIVQPCVQAVLLLFCLLSSRPDADAFNIPAFCHLNLQASDRKNQLDPLLTLLVESDNTHSQPFTVSNVI